MDEGPGGPLRVRVVGGFDVEGVDPARLGSRKARTLLKVLALARGRAVPTDRLVDVLWGDHPPADPAGQVAVLVSRLRGVLGGDRLARSDAGYVFRTDWLDLGELDALAAEASARLAAGLAAPARAAARGALELARGPLLPDEEGEWVDGERAVVARGVARLRLVAAEAALLAGDAADGAELAEAALDHDPYDEVALRTLMRAHAALGRPASALAVYSRVRARLRDDLGVDPSPETEELHTAILFGDVAAPAPPPVRVVGRASELVFLDDRLDEVVKARRPVAVVVEGETGMGKTTLVTAWASFVEANRGAVVLRARCDELGRDLPLQPVLDALARHARAAGADAASVVDAATRSSGAPARTMVADANVGREALHAALLAVLDAVGDPGPVVLVVDDLDGASAATLEWLHAALDGDRALLVLATRGPGGPGLPGARHLVLPPFDLAATAQLVGDASAPELLARTGGNPLLLVAVAGAGASDSVDDAVAARADALGAGAATLRTAATLGPVVDLDLLAAVLRHPAVELLGHLEEAAAAGLLVERGDRFAFAHELVRTALESGTSAARRALAHREAARALVARPRHDPLTVAWHAGLGGDVDLAVEALVDAAGMAASRFELDTAERLASDALALDDTIAARMARARIRMSRWDIAGATEDVERALALGAGVDAYELAGWIAYYGRDYEAARVFADEGRTRAGDTALRASCRVLAGRVRHSVGELDEADALLTDAANEGPGDVRALAQVWLAQLRVHQGSLDDAVALLDRGLLDPDRLGHPFALLHGLFARSLALAMSGRVARALDALDALDAEVGRQLQQAARFTFVGGNVRGWLLRNLGRLGEADELNERSAAQLAPPHAEARYAGLLDLVDGRLARGDLDGAGAALEAAAGVLTWRGTMFWRQRQRHVLGSARLDLACGRAADAFDRAVEVAATDVASSRHALFARLLAARASCELGRDPGPTFVADLARLDDVAVPEAWWVTAELAAATGSAQLWSDAERRVERLASAAGPHADRLRDDARARFERLRRSR